MKHIKHFSYAMMAASAFFVSSVHGYEPIWEYAEKCDDEIGISVPDFDCDTGTLVPGQTVYDPHDLIPASEEAQLNQAAFDGPCQNPQFIDEGNVCNPGSRVKVLGDDGDAFVVAVCRRGGATAPKYEDIAIIQTSRITGATCFYQRSTQMEQDSYVPSPGTVDGGGWMKTDVAIGICARCHDGNAIIRSPFIKDLIPSDFNQSGSPYWLVGEYPEHRYFQPVGLNSDNNECTTCHRIGTIAAFGASGNFNKPYRERYANLLYAYMSVMPRAVLDNRNIYQALDESLEKWWMPAGRTEASHPEQSASIVNYFLLENCKEQFILANDGRSVTDGLIYPDDANCTVKPTDKFILPKPENAYRLVNLVDSRIIYQTAGYAPTAGYYSGSNLWDEWFFEREPAENAFKIRNASSGRYLCIDHAGDKKACQSWELDFYPSRWKLAIYNDYEENNGFPSGRTFRIESVDQPGNRFYMNGSALEIGTGTGKTVWRMELVDN